MAEPPVPVPFLFCHRPDPFSQLSPSGTTPGLLRPNSWISRCAGVEGSEVQIMMKPSKCLLFSVVASYVLGAKFKGA